MQGGTALAGMNTGNPLDVGMLECLAVIAEANNRTVEDELNIAVKTYVLNQFAEHGENRLIEQAFAEQSVAASKP